MNYQFPPPPKPEPVADVQLTKHQAAKIVRNACQCLLKEALYWVEVNYGDGPIFGAELGNFICDFYVSRVGVRLLEAQGIKQHHDSTTPD